MRRSTPLAELLGSVNAIHVRRATRVIAGRAGLSHIIPMTMKMDYSTASGRNEHISEKPETASRTFYLLDNRICTLNPERLTARDLLYWAGMKQPRVRVDLNLKTEYAGQFTYNTRFNEPARPGIFHDPFPPEASGFLYYHPPNSDIFYPEGNEFNVGHIRFRCVTSPETFHEGRDLLLPTNVPWHCSGGSLLKRCRPLLDLALQEGLITEEEVAPWSRNYLSKFIRTFDQPFVLKLATRENEILLAPDGLTKDVPRMRIFVGFRDGRSTPSCFTSGQIVCHFEAGSLDDRGGMTSLVLRVDRVLEPVVFGAGAPETMPLPSGGELLMLPRKVKGPMGRFIVAVKPWTLKLDCKQSVVTARNVHALYASQRSGETN